MIWLLCEICRRVTQSLGKGRASALFVLGEVVKAISLEPNLSVIEVDSVVVRRPTKAFKKRPLETALDLQVLEGGQPLLWLEVKTGWNSLEDMTSFQLDCSDCDDIMNVVRTTNLPALLVHAQVVKQSAPPTMKLVPLGMWWTDIFSFAAAFMGVGPRRREGGKAAASFNKDCFRPVDELMGFFNAGGLDDLRRRFGVSGCPDLYDATRALPKKKVAKKRSKKKVVKKRSKKKVAKKKVGQ